MGELQRPELQCPDAHLHPFEHLSRMHLNANAACAGEGVVPQIDYLPAVLFHRDLIAGGADTQPVPSVLLNGRRVAVFRNERLTHAIQRARENAGMACLVKEVGLVSGSGPRPAEPDAAVTGPPHLPFGPQFEIGPLFFGEEIAARAAGPLS